MSRRTNRPAAPARRFQAVDVGYLNTSFAWCAIKDDAGRYAMDRSKGDVRRFLVRASELSTVDCNKLEFLSDAEQAAANKALGF